MESSVLGDGLAPGNDKFRQVVDAGWTARPRCAGERGPEERTCELMGVR